MHKRLPCLATVGGQEGQGKEESEWPALHTSCHLLPMIEVAG